MVRPSADLIKYAITQGITSLEPGRLLVVQDDTKEGAVHMDATIVL